MVACPPVNRTIDVKLLPCGENERRNRVRTKYVNTQDECLGDRYYDSIIDTVGYCCRRTIICCYCAGENVVLSRSRGSFATPTKTSISTATKKLRFILRNVKQLIKRFENKSFFKNKCIYKIKYIYY